MKDPVHHRKAVQKQVIRFSRRQSTETPLTNNTVANTVPQETLVLNSGPRFNHDQRLDHEGKRRILFNTIPQRGRMNLPY